jgi:hypothetical protein
MKGRSTLVFPDAKRDAFDQPVLRSEYNVCACRLAPP